MKKTVSLSVGVVIAFFGLASFVAAASIFDISYPIAELGGCESQAACKAYCDDSANQSACFSFAEKMGFVSKEKVEAVKTLSETAGPGGCRGAAECRAYCDDPAHEDACIAFAEQHGIGLADAPGQQVRERARLIKEQGGPGGCQSQQECRAFCENPAHQEECLAFAEQHSLIDQKELKAARAVLVQGGPGGCRGEQECHAYCNDPGHAEECISFAEQQGFMSAEEAQKARAMANKTGPGGCKGERCRAYCDDPAHAEECIAFAVENGFMSKEEAEKAKKFAGKPGPGGCQGEQCRTYCDNQSHQQECFQFAVDNGLIPPEEIERAKKFREVAQQGGPGGCQGEQCRAYCDNPAHQEECFAFAKEHGLVDEKEVKMMERGRELSQKVKEMGGPGGCKSDMECQQFCKDPSHVEECLAFAVAHGGVQKDEALTMLKRFTEESARAQQQFGPPGGGPFPGGPMTSNQQFGGPMMGGPGGTMQGMPGQGFPGQGMMMPPPQFDQQFQERFQKFEQFQQFEGEFRKPEMMQAQGFSGPGGCTSPEECMKYCSDPAHRSECAQQNPSAGSPPPSEMFRQMQPGSESILNHPENAVTGSAQCGGPRPMMPTPAGCEGPVCLNGKWEFKCPQGERIAPPSPDGTYDPNTGKPIEENVQTGTMKDFPLSPGMQYPDGMMRPPEGFKPPQDSTNFGGQYSDQYQKPPEGMMMYPAGGMMPPPSGTYQQQPGGMYPSSGTMPPPPSGDMYQQQPSGSYPPPPSGDYQQPPPPPPSGAAPNFFFANLLEAFAKALQLK